MKSARSATLFLALILALVAVRTLGGERRRASLPVSGLSHYHIALDGITALATAPDGSVWALPNFFGPEAAYHLSVDGTITSIAVAGAADYAVVDSSGLLWLGASETIARVREGEPPRSFPRAGFISGLALDHDGRPWFTDRAQNRVGFVSVETATTVEFSLTESLARPTLIAAGPDGKMWFVTESGRVGSVDAEGVLVEHRFPELEGKPISAVTSSPDAFLLAVACRPCNRVVCRYPDDHGLIVRITGDYASQTVADVGHNNLYALASGPSGTIYALEGYLSIFLGGKTFAGPLLVIRPNGTTNVIDTGATLSTPTAAGFLAASPDGSLWVAHSVGGGGVLRFPAGLLR
ncbi:MAG: virginiamycin lyase [Thermoanaerobaculia bacterium]|jgi:streptogramin lyase|nr:virginiamycin lyase [Thermoanaerobaculia bacterium]